MARTRARRTARMMPARPGGSRHHAAAVRLARRARRSARARASAPARPDRVEPVVERADLVEDGVGHRLLLVARGLLDALVAQRLAVLDRDASGTAGAASCAPATIRAPRPARSSRPTRAPGARSRGARSRRSGPVRERPPSQYMATQPPSSRTFSAVTKVSSSRCPRRTGKTPPWRVDELHRRLEELRLRHELHLAPDRGADEEVVHERGVVGREDHRAARRHLLGVDAAHPEEDPRVDRGRHAHDLVDDVRRARARPLVEAVEVLRGPRVLVDLGPDLDAFV